MPPFPLVVLALVITAIVARRIGRVRIGIWQAMSAGGIAIVVSGDMAPLDALAAIELDVMLFLLGAFVIGRALEDSGSLARVSARLFDSADSTGALLLRLLFAAGIGSALLMNDTLAIVGTPVVLLLARSHGLRPEVLLLALAFGVTIGSTMSPIGNPQNLLIAVGGTLEHPFLEFLRYLALPTLLNLLVAWLWLRLVYRSQFRPVARVEMPMPLDDPHLARLAKLALALLLALVALRIGLSLFDAAVVLPMSAIAVTAALPLVVASPQRMRLLRRADWPTLAFFAAMFVLIDSVWQTGVLQAGLARLAVDPASVTTIGAVSVVMSQLISNVPLVALYLPVLEHAGGDTRALMALAAASTVAGNAFILGAASNVIIAHNAEQHGGVRISYREFTRVGLPLTVMNLAVYWAFLAWM